MNSEISHAFGHPADRSVATAGDGPLDRISLRDHLVEVEIGAFQAERGTTQRISFNVVVEVTPLPDDVDDDVDRILSYDRVTEAIAHELAAERLNLLETLAERVADRILLEPQAIRVFVRIEKLDRGNGDLGVEIVRSGDPMGKGVNHTDVPHPRLMFLSNAGIDSPLLGGWIDQMASRDHPLILCVGAHPLAVPHTGHKMTQQRIDLLAIEQNAWRLAARDPRCVVVATRTELDWAMKNGQICVWAPSKIVLDAVEGPSAAPSEPVALAAWFAATFAGDEMLVVDQALPENPGVPLRAIGLEQVTL
ncbi:dihydroneopterin aldolase [Rhodobacteraceae bacterium M382]|nr:dihydroneopterin aldolase [Rhodobacteraceae bacterium M382]